MSNITTDFVTTTKKIVAEVRGVLTALHLIREDVRVIRDQVVSESNKQSSNQPTNESGAKEREEIAVLSKVLDEDQSGSKKGQRKQETESGSDAFLKRLKRDVKKPKFIIELLALAGLVLYTCETRRTNNLTKVALQTSKTQFAQSQTTSSEQFKRDQRPYVWISKLEPEQVKAGEKISWNYWLSNYGKSPAINAHVIAKVNVGKDANVAPVWVFTKDEAGLIIPQGVPPPPSKGTVYSTAYSDKIVADPATVDFDGGYYIFIHIEYVGLDRETTYISNICYFHLKTKATASCRGYNEIK